MICNNSILTIHKKNKLQAFQSFPLYFAFIFLSIQAFSQVCFHPLLLLAFHLYLSSLPTLRVFQGKTYPAPSARPFGAMRRLELWY